MLCAVLEICFLERCCVREAILPSLCFCVISELLRDSVMNRLLLLIVPQPDLHDISDDIAWLFEL